MRLTCEDEAVGKGPGGLVQVCTVGPFWTLSRTEMGPELPRSPKLFDSSNTLAKTIGPAPDKVAPGGPQIQRTDPSRINGAADRIARRHYPAARPRTVTEPTRLAHAEGSL